MEDQETLDAIKAECQELAKQIAELKRSQPSPQTLTSTPSNAQDTRIQLVQNKERSLLARAEYMKENLPNVESHDSVVMAKAEENILKSLNEVDDVIIALRAQLEQDTAALRFEEEVLAERNELKATIEAAATTHAPASTSPGPATAKTTTPGGIIGSTSQEELRIQAVTNSYQSANREMMAQMSAFLDTHFPAGSMVPENTSLPAIAAASEKQARKGRRKSGEETDTTYVPLKDLLQDLMNLVVQSPNDPYLDLADEHWPPHIELLISSHIAVKHPTNPHSIRLVDFSQ